MRKVRKESQSLQLAARRNSLAFHLNVDINHPNKQWKLLLFSSNTSAIVVEMLVLTICASHNFVVSLNNKCSLCICFLLFSMTVSLNFSNRIGTKDCGAHCNNVVVLPTNQYEFLMTAAFPNGRTNFTLLAVFFYLSDPKCIYFQLCFYELYGSIVSFTSTSEIVEVK